jgi:DNA adenine methylase
VDADCALNGAREIRVGPFLKWAGGKRWLFDKTFVESLPLHRRYVEPFLGGGAGFFAINPAVALLSDVNQDLINLYEVIRDSHIGLVKMLASHQRDHCAEYYYEVRKQDPGDKIERAARMLYLNRTCYNGLYRLNKMGRFNVPIGTKTAVLLPTDDFASAAAMLARVQLRTCDFATTIGEAGDGDLLFVDPPYTVKHDNNGFVKYNEQIFSWKDQERLRQAVFEAADRGASVIVTNANHTSVIELYNGLGRSSVVDRASVISGKVGGRSSVSELLVRV